MELRLLRYYLTVAKEQSFTKAAEQLHITQPTLSRHICTKYRGLFLGYFLTAYALQTVILLAFGRSFQRVPWHINRMVTRKICRNIKIWN